jgi:hypothetical protein
VTPTSRRAVAIAAVLVLLGVFGAAAWRELAAGARGVDDCDVATARKDWPAAVAGARDAAEAVLPGSPYPARGYDRLAAIAKDAEARGDDAVANDAWRAMQAAARATRGAFVKTSEWQAMATEGLARVAAHAAGPAPKDTDAPAEGPAANSALLAAIARDEAPPVATFALLAAAAVAFFGGAAWTAWRASDALTWARARVPAAIAAAGLLLYVALSLGWLG